MRHWKLGRDLHEFLEVEIPYHKWFPRMCEYGFTDGIDYAEVTDKFVPPRVAARLLITSSPLIWRKSFA